MPEMLIFALLAYPLVGVAWLLWDASRDEDVYDDLQIYRWELVGLMATCWPVFVWQSIRSRL